MRPETPRLTVDAVIMDEDYSRIILIRRKNDPFRGFWALPGGFVDVGETVEAACIREVREETGMEVDVIKLLGVFSDPGRDPRGHTVSVVFICRPVLGEPTGRDDALEAAWIPFPTDFPLAFDHAKVLEAVKKSVDV